MVEANELERIQYKEQEALRRKQSAWMAYTSVNRRLDDAYYLMLCAWEDFEDARDDLRDGRDDEVRFELARKRHKSAQEEFLYQRKERRRARMEFEMAQTEHWQWRERIQQRLAEGDDVCGMNVVATN